jgi:hypothetical protein
MGRVKTPSCLTCDIKMTRIYVRPTGIKTYCPVGFVCVCGGAVYEWPPDVRKWMEGR